MKIRNFNQFLYLVKGLKLFWTLNNVNQQNKNNWYQNNKTQNDLPPQVMI